MPHLSSAPHSVVIFTAFPDPSPVLFYPCVPFPCTQPFSPCSHCHFITPLPRSSFLPSPFLPACDPICFLENTISLIESQNGLGWKGTQSPLGPHPCRGQVCHLPAQLPRASSNLVLSASRDGAPQLLWATHLMLQGCLRPGSWKTGLFLEVILQHHMKAF